MKLDEKRVMKKKEMQIERMFRKILWRINIKSEKNKYARMH